MEIDSEPIVMKEAKKFTSLDQKIKDLQNEVGVLDRDYQTKRQKLRADIDILQSDAKEVAMRLKAVLERYINTVRPSDEPDVIVPVRKYHTRARALGDIFARINNKALAVKTIRRGTMLWLRSVQAVDQQDIENWFENQGFTDGASVAQARTVIYYIRETEKWLYSPIDKKYHHPKVIISSEHEMGV